MNFVFTKNGGKKLIFGPTQDNPLSTFFLKFKLRLPTFHPPPTTQSTNFVHLFDCCASIWGRRLRSAALFASFVSPNPIFPFQFPVVVALHWPPKLRASIPIPKSTSSTPIQSHLSHFFPFKNAIHRGHYRWQRLYCLTFDPLAPIPARHCRNSNNWPKAIQINFIPPIALRKSSK